MAVSYYASIFKGYKKSKAGEKKGIKPEIPEVSGEKAHDVYNFSSAVWFNFG